MHPDSCTFSPSQVFAEHRRLLEEAHIKLSSFVSDLLGASARRMLQALAEGETNPEALAGLADKRLRATPEQLRDALGACTELNSVYRRLLKMALKEVGLLEEEIQQLDQELASLLRRHEDAVKRLAQVPGLGVDSAQQILAEASRAGNFPPNAPQHRSAKDCERPSELARFPCPSQPKLPRLQTLRLGRIARICVALPRSLFYQQ